MSTLPFRCLEGKKILKIDVLGTSYDVVLLDYRNDPYFEKAMKEAGCIES